MSKELQLNDISDSDFLIAKEFIEENIMIGNIRVDFYELQVNHKRHLEKPRAVKLKKIGKWKTMINLIKREDLGFLYRCKACDDPFDDFHDTDGITPYDHILLRHSEIFYS